MKMKVMTVVGTRPEIIRLSEVMKELDRRVEHILVHTGQSYDYQLNEIFFKDLGLRAPDFFLNAAGEGGVKTAANILAKVDDLLAQKRPDTFLVLGDTNSALSVYAAKRHKIPVFHMEAGNRCFDERVPEEVNRRIVDHTSDINLVYSDLARQHLVREGFPPERVIKTGSPMFEVLSTHQKKIEKSTIVKQLDLKKGAYFVASLHREENVGSVENLTKLVAALTLIAKKFAQPVILSTHPRTRVALEAIGVPLPDEVRVATPFGFFDYVKLEIDARCTLSDSGTISEESSILNFPAVNMREAHERPEAMDEAAVTMTGLDPEAILGAVENTLAYSYDERRDFRLPADYAVPNVSKKVVRIIESYTDYVNRRVWYKS